MPTCSRCGQENPQIARFCLACGAPLAEAERPRREERRLVTALFVDLVGFTSRAEKLDPEDVRTILTAYHQRVRDEIEAFGGVVEKFIGDAILGVFGAPVAYGDDPERAVRAALSIREALHEMNLADANLDLQVRIAVNTGEAIVDLDARQHEGESMVVGDVINTASRLQSAAPVDGVLVGAETYASTRSTIVYAEAPPVVAKGKEAPVEVWVALAEATPAGERAAPRAPIVGRSRELELLGRVWEQVCTTSRPHLVTVIGPAGIGKTRLAAEFARIVEAQDGRALRGRVPSYGGASAYVAFAQQVTQVAKIFDSDDPADASEKLRAMVADVVGESADEVTAALSVLLGLATSAHGDRDALFDAALRFVECLARAQPTMLVFEDIHWADSSLLDLLQTISGRVGDVPLLLVALTRPELLTSRPTWGGGLLSYTALPLEPLDEAASRELAAHLLASRPCEDDQSGRVASVGEGNPLFIEELAATVTESGAGEELPTTIRALVSARLDALPPEERAVLLDAAIAGKVFWRGALERLREGDDGLADVIGSLEQRDLLRREAVSRIQGETQYIFKHVLIRDIAYATVPRTARRKGHAAVARFLEDVTQEAGESAHLLAHHWREAGDAGRALHYLLLAADQAGRGWAKDRALGLYREALDLLPEDDVERRREIHRKRAVMAQAMYHVPDAELLAGQPRAEAS